MSGSLLALQTATRAARVRGDASIGTCFDKGGVRVVTVVYPPQKNGASKVTYLTGPLSISDAVAFLDSRAVAA